MLRKFILYYVLVYFLISLPVHETGHAIMMASFGYSFTIRYCPPFGAEVVCYQRITGWKLTVCCLAGGMLAGTVLLALHSFAKDVDLKSALLCHSMTNFVYAPFDAMLCSKLYYYLSALVALAIVFALPTSSKPRSSRRR